MLFFVPFFGGFRNVFTERRVVMLYKEESLQYNTPSAIRLLSADELLGVRSALHSGFTQLKRTKATVHPQQVLRRR